MENAFRHLGGVTATVVIDNFKAGVLQADWYDPQLNPKLEEFAQHYGTVILPTKPAMPRHKGKVESGVKFSQNNAVKGRSFESLTAQNRHLSDWEKNVADTRIHGTMRRQGGRLFEGVERTALQPLPAGLFPVFVEALRSVHRDGYVEFQKAYYSAPPEYVWRQVWVWQETRLLRLYNTRREQIALHALPNRESSPPTPPTCTAANGISLNGGRIPYEAVLLTPELASATELTLFRSIALSKSSGPLRGHRMLVPHAKRRSPFAPWQRVKVKIRGHPYCCGRIHITGSTAIAPAGEHGLSDVGNAVGYCHIDQARSV